ncbi:hypothetical protein KUDE01_031452 [Dissostichus eleginoides]|uniref:Uncharacterized protein n=1 Tax=Dissostichus eleginoides TaxID=100907 RepID=A0AAD9BLX1_DISEL|nr:hypothetical protein KUDE01_031452 [Dissostichus eleginoides]
METKFPTLRRPKKKLCYLTNKESPTKKAEGLLILEDIDRIFDDLDPPCDDLLPSSSQYMTFNVEANQSEGEASTCPQKGKLMGTIQKGHMGPKGDEIHPSRSPSPKLVIDQDIPFEAHMPAKTSSPIETNMAVKALDIEKDRSVSPLLFACEDEGDAKTEPPPNGHVTEESIDFESPPSKVVLSRPKMSSQQKKVEEACKESQTLKINPPQKPQTPVVEVQRKTPRIEMVDPPAAAVRREPELAAPEKTIETVPEQPLVEPARVQKNFAAFIQKLRGAAQSKPACTRKSASPVKVPTPPPEPEDDFLILEDDAAPFSFSIRSKSAKKQSGTTSIDKGSVTDKSTKGSSAVTQQEPEETERKPREPSGKRKTKKTKEKKNEVTEADRAEEELPGPEEPPVDSIDEKKPNNKKPNNKKKQRLKKVPSEDSDEEEERRKQARKHGKMNPL